MIISGPPFVLVVLHPRDTVETVRNLAAERGSIDIFITDDVSRLVDQAERSEPSILLVSARALGPGPSDALGRVRRAAPLAVVVALTHDHLLVHELLAAGPDAVLITTEPGISITVGDQAGEPGPDDRETPAATAVPAGLTVRERQVLNAMAAGLTNEGIARRLEISVETVKTHARRIYRMLGAQDRAQAVFIAVQLGVIVPQATPVPRAPRQRPGAQPADAG